MSFEWSKIIQKRVPFPLTKEILRDISNNEGHGEYRFYCRKDYDPLRPECYPSIERIDMNDRGAPIRAADFWWGEASWTKEKWAVVPVRILPDEGPHVSWAELCQMASTPSNIRRITNNTRDNYEVFFKSEQTEKGYSLNKGQRIDAADGTSRPLHVSGGDWLNISYSGEAWVCVSKAKIRAKKALIASFPPKVDNNRARLCWAELAEIAVPESDITGLCESIWDTSHFVGFRVRSVDSYGEEDEVEVLEWDASGNPIRLKDSDWMRLTSYATSWLIVRKSDLTKRLSEEREPPPYLCWAELAEISIPEGNIDCLWNSGKSTSEFLGFTVKNNDCYLESEGKEVMAWDSSNDPIRLKGESWMHISMYSRSWLLVRKATLSMRLKKAAKSEKNKQDKLHKKAVDTKKEVIRDIIHLSENIDLSSTIASDEALKQKTEELIVIKQSVKQSNTQSNNLSENTMTTSTPKNSMMQKMTDRMFKKVEGVVFDMTTNSMGVIKDDSIFSVSKLEVEAEGSKPIIEFTVVENLFSDLSINMPAFAMPKPFAQVQIGDLILHQSGAVAGWVTAKTAKTVKVLKTTGVSSVMNPVKTSLMGDGATIMVVMDMMGGSAGGSEGMNPMMMLAMMGEDGDSADGSSKDDMMKMMMLTGAMGGGNAGGMNQMLLPMMMMGKKGDSSNSSGFDFKDIMMLQMMSGAQGQQGMGGMNPMMMLAMMK